MSMEILEAEKSNADTTSSRATRIVERIGADEDFRKLPLGELDHLHDDFTRYATHTHDVPHKAWNLFCSSELKKIKAELDMLREQGQILSLERSYLVYNRVGAALLGGGWTCDDRMAEHEICGV